MKHTITTDAAPSAIGPYSQGVRAGRFLFVSGQLPIDPATGEFVGTDVAIQTRQCLKNLVAIVRAGGGSENSVVKTTVFLQNMADFSVMNGEYEAVFVDDPPARAAVEVSALPKGALVEIEAVALVGND